MMNECLTCGGPTDLGSSGHIRFLHELRTSQRIKYCELIKTLESRNAKFEAALKKIVKVNQFGRDNGPIVTSEHYEAAWLDCVELALTALDEKDK